MSAPMRDSLDHLPPKKRAELALVKDILFEEFERMQARATTERKQRGRILKVILFGSYARGTWVEEHRVGGGYFSDYDLMVVVNDEAFVGPDCDVWDRAEERFFTDPRIQTPVTVVVETLNDLNNRLMQGHFFYSDVVAEGIALSEVPGKPLARKQNLSAEEALEVAEEHYGHWMPEARKFLKGHDLYMAEGDDYRRQAVFLLHQATEAAYCCVLTVVGGYTPNSHNIKHLRGLAETLSDRLFAVWPRETKADEGPFNRLKDAYVKARYSPRYSITAEELGYLRERVAALHEVVEGLCDECVQALSKASESVGETEK